MKEATEIYVGIDISKETLDVALRPSERTWQVSYTKDGVGELVKELGSLVLATSKSGTLLLRRDQGEMAVL